MVAARIKTSACSGRRVDEHLKPAVISVFSLTSLTVWSSDRPSRNTLLKPLWSAHRWFCEEFNWGPLLSNNRVQVGQTEVITDPMLALDAHTTLPEWHFSNIFWSSACIEKDELKLGFLGLHKHEQLGSQFTKMVTNQSKPCWSNTWTLVFIPCEIVVTKCCMQHYWNGEHRLCFATCRESYGSVSAGREFWLFFVLFFKSRASVWPNLIR